MQLVPWFCGMVRGPVVPRDRATHPGTGDLGHVPAAAVVMPLAGRRAGTPGRARWQARRLVLLWTALPVAVCGAEAAPGTPAPSPGVGP
jgi:hypothetical protein